MVKKQNLVSIITPTYNSDKYITKLFESILIQDYSNIEMFIIDDGSTDGSKNVIESYIPRFKERGYNLEYIYQSNRGQSVAINNALKLVNGDYLVWPDADDFYLKPNSISKMANALKESADDVSMVRVYYTIFDEDEKVVGSHIVHQSNRYKTDLFEDAVFNENGFWFPPGGYMAKVAKIDELIADREIYTEKKAGQNFQLYFPLLYKNKCLTLEEHLYGVVAHGDSHSRNSISTEERKRVYLRTAKHTLKKMKLDKEYLQYLFEKLEVIWGPDVDRSVTRRALRRRRIAKRLIKGILPHGVIVILRNKGILNTPPPEVIVQVQPKSHLEHLNAYDNHIFASGFAQQDLSQQNIEGWLLFCAHVLEKAMSRVKFEKGHNFFRLEQLAGLLEKWREEGFSVDSFAYRYALSSIKSYIELHETHGFSTDEIRSLLGDKYELALGSQDDLAGYKVLSKADKGNNKSLNFAALQHNRYSVREFSPAKVSKKLLNDAIELAMKSPSVCNRQPVRVHSITNPEKIGKILAIQGGFQGYEPPQSLLLISTDIRNYVGEHERNQGFIDGGSYAMSLLLSLEFYGLAACPLHAMLSPEVDVLIKDILDIKTPEYLIMFIAVGHFNDKNKVAVSSRYKASEITKEYA